jgi:PAS domain-containing protein
LREVVWAVSVADRRLVYVNPVFEHVYQYSIVELLTNPEIWLQDVHPDDRNRVLTDWQKVFNGTPFDTEYRCSVGMGP